MLQHSIYRGFANGINCDIGREARGTHERQTPPICIHEYNWALKSLWLLQHTCYKGFIQSKILTSVGNRICVFIFAGGPIQHGTKHSILKFQTKNTHGTASSGFLKLFQELRKRLMDPSWGAAAPPSTYCQGCGLRKAPEPLSSSQSLLHSKTSTRQDQHFHLQLDLAPFQRVSCMQAKSSIPTKYGKEIILYLGQFEKGKTTKTNKKNPQTYNQKISPRILCLDEYGIVTSNFKSKNKR